MQCHFNNHHFPLNAPNQIWRGDSRIFCGDYSHDGSIVCAASQDHVINLFDTHSIGIDHECHEWTLAKQVQANFNGWAIIDGSLSADNLLVAYRVLKWIVTTNCTKNTTYLDVIHVDMQLIDLGGPSRQTHFTGTGQKRWRSVIPLISKRSEKIHESSQ